jgi:ElaA protein
MSKNDSINWQSCRLEQLTARQLYAVLAAREAVFVVEQRCAYLELDGQDIEAMHLIAWSGGEVAAYLRILPPGARFNRPSIGRVMTARAFRGRGLGRELMVNALQHLDGVLAEYVNISAQTYLERFYRSFGFEPVSEIYMEDGIPHVEMIRKMP